MEPPRAATTSCRLLVVLAVALAALLGTAGGAQAHTGLASSNPADGATVTAPMDAVALTFTGRVLLREVTVTGPDGASAATAEAAASGTVVTAAVALTTAGTYTVRYAVNSDDGHPLDGSVSFTYAPPVAATPSTAAGTSQPTATASAVEPSEAASDSTIDDSDSSAAWLVPVLVGVAVVVVLAVVLLLRRSRSRG